MINNCTKVIDCTIHMTYQLTLYRNEDLILCVTFLTRRGGRVVKALDC